LGNRRSKRKIFHPQMSSGSLQTKKIRKGGEDRRDGREHNPSPERKKVAAKNIKKVSSIRGRVHLWPKNRSRKEKTPAAMTMPAGGERLHKEGYVRKGKRAQ